MIRNFGNVFNGSNSKPNIIYSQIIKIKYLKKLNMYYYIIIMLKKLIILFNSDM